MLQIIQLLAAAIGVLLDQWFKKWTVLHIGVGEVKKLIPGIIHLTFVKNDGAALSMFSGMRWVLLAISAAFVVAGVWALLKKKLTNPLGTWALAAIISGAAGNAIDRALFGYVVDMFEFEIVFDFFVFNIADVFITFGGIAFCLYIIIFEFAKKPEKPAEIDDGTDNS